MAGLCTLGSHPSSEEVCGRKIRRPVAVALPRPVTSEVSTPLRLETAGHHRIHPHDKETALCCVSEALHYAKAERGR